MNPPKIATFSATHKCQASKSKMNIQKDKRHSPAPSPMVPVRDLEVQSFLPGGPDPVPLTEPS